MTVGVDEPYLNARIRPGGLWEWDGATFCAGAREVPPEHSEHAAVVDLLERAHHALHSEPARYVPGSFGMYEAPLAYVETMLAARELVLENGWRDDAPQLWEGDQA